MKKYNIRNSIIIVALNIVFSIICGIILFFYSLVIENMDDAIFKIIPAILQFITTGIVFYLIGKLFSYYNKNDIKQIAKWFLILSTIISFGLWMLSIVHFVLPFLYSTSIFFIPEPISILFSFFPIPGVFELDVLIFMGLENVIKCIILYLGMRGKKRYQAAK